MVKIADSAAIKQYIPSRPRAEGFHSFSDWSIANGAVLIGNSFYSYFQSGSSGCLRSQSGRRLLTDGITAKLYTGGGEMVVHSRVHASHGSLPAILPLREDHSTFTMKINTATPWKNTPTGTMKIRVCQPRTRSLGLILHGMPSSPGMF